MKRKSQTTTLGTLTLLTALLALALTAPAQSRVRTEVPFPDLPGLVTLRCDFHSHTVFSDGSVWPIVRVEEAWRDGLDAIALTDHIEYQPHKADVSTKHGRAAEIARPYAEPLGILVIPGAEITRGEPPGHLNALLLTNTAALDQKDYRAALSNAFHQGAFIFWNHPGWKQPNRKSVWYDEQEEFYTKGWLRGIEVINGPTYDPIAHGWCRDKKLALIAGSDVHGPIAFEYGAATGKIRPMTLVFAKTRSMEAIREALLARRTVLFGDNRLYGAAEHLEPLFQRSVEIVNPEVRVSSRGRSFLQVRNKSAVNYEVNFNSDSPELLASGRVILSAGKVSLLEVRAASGAAAGLREVKLNCRITNALTAPNRPLTTTLRAQVQIAPGN